MTEEVFGRPDKDITTSYKLILNIKNSEEIVTISSALVTHWKPET